MGLTTSGYDMADPKDVSAQEIIDRIRSTEWPPAVLRYFAAARTDRVAVNPYWPRGSLLSTASLFVGPDHHLSNEAREELERAVLGADSLSPEDKTAEALADVLSWLTGLPEALALVMSHSVFPSLWHDYLAIVEERIGGWETEVRRAVAALEATVGVAAGENPRVEFLPNLLQSPYLADYAARGNTLGVIAARPSPLSIVHELLHQLFDRPVREAVLEAAKTSGAGTAVPRVRGALRGLTALRDRVNLDKMKSLGYAWDDSVESVVRVLQETSVRAASIWVIYRDDPERSEASARDDVAQGFELELDFLHSLRKHWTGSGSLSRVLVNALEGVGPP